LTKLAAVLRKTVLKLDRPNYTMLNLE